MSTTIVIPIHTSSLTENELISLQQMKLVFAKRHFSIVCPTSVNSSLGELFSEVDHSVLNFPEKMFKSTRTYNRLLTSLDFYRCFNKYSHILICQLDVYVFFDAIREWEQRSYDFVGAPTFEGYHGNTTQFARTLNGGISLRNVASMIRVLEQVSFRINSLSALLNMEKSYFLKCVRLVRDGLLFNYNTAKLQPILNEDLYWSYLVPQQHKWFNVPSPIVAMPFSFDVNPRYLYSLNKNKLPMAIHSWWKYDEMFVRKLISNSQ